MSENTVTKEQIDSIIAASIIEDIKMGEKTTVVTMTLPNGFVLVESSSCVDPENYDHDMGVSICKERFENKIWAFEGYKLQCELSKL